MSFESQGNQTFWRDIPGFYRDMPELAEQFEKNMFVFNFGGQTAGGHPKPLLGPGKPPFAAHALRELESACRVSIL